MKIANAENPMERKLLKKKSLHNSQRWIGSNIVPYHRRDFFPASNFHPLVFLFAFRPIALCNESFFSPNKSF